MICSHLGLTMLDQDCWPKMILKKKNESLVHISTVSELPDFLCESISPRSDTDNSIPDDLACDPPEHFYQNLDTINDVSSHGAQCVELINDVDKIDIPIRSFQDHKLVKHSQQ